MTSKTLSSILIGKVFEDGENFFSKTPTDVNVLSCWPKAQKYFGISERLIFPPRDIRRNPRSMCARVPQSDGAICSKKRKIVPYHGDSPNTRIGACLWSPSPIMAPDWILILQNERTLMGEKQRQVGSHMTCAPFVNVVE